MKSPAVKAVPQQLSMSTPARAVRGAWPNIALAAVIVLAAVVACNKTWDHDIFWHLKSGQWMLQHKQVLDRDLFSSDDPSAENSRRWVNVHWLFQVMVAAAHAVGGFGGLVLLKMAVFAGTLAVLAFHLRGRITPAWLMLAGTFLVLGAETRIRERPELVTYLLLLATLVLVESVRRGAAPRRLWGLVPINILWVNMHGLFILGPLAAWAAVAGAWADSALKRGELGNLAFRPPAPRPGAGPAKGLFRRLVGALPIPSRQVLLPVAGSTLACLVNPWPLEVATHPLLLASRVSGEDRMYRFGVQELLPTYANDPRQAPIMLWLGLSALLTLILLVRLLLELVKSSRRRVPSTHLLWFVMFLGLSLLAVRNVALLAVAGALLLAVHGGTLLSEIADARPRLRRLRVPAAALLLAGMAVAAGGFATEEVYYRQKRTGSQFGLGLADGVHPLDLASWLGQVEADGDVMPLDFGEGGMFIYYCWPKRKVYMDGRLEVMSPKRFERLYEYRTKLLSSAQADDPRQTPLPPSVRFVVVRISEDKHLEVLSNCPRFKLLYVDRVAACFGRLSRPGEQVTWPGDQDLPASNLDRLDRPLDLRGRRPGAPGLEAEPRRCWYRRNVEPAHWELGTMLFHVGLDGLAVRYLTVAERLGHTDRLLSLGMLAQAHQRLSEYQPIEPDRELPTDPNLSRALALYDRMELSNLSDDWAARCALVRVRAYITGRQIDAAASAIRQYMENLPIPERWHPTGEAIAVRDSIKAAHDAARARRASFEGLSTLAPAEQAHLLLRKDVGLLDEAIAVLLAATQPRGANAGTPPPETLPPAARMLLGDLYLRKGLTGQARRQYLGALTQNNHPLILMRQGLCDWADGDFGQAIANLSESARSNLLEPALYLGLLYEQLGDYASSGAALDGHVPAGDVPEHEKAAQLAAQLGARLKVRGFSPAGASRPAGSDRLTREIVE